MVNSGRGSLHACNVILLISMDGIYTKTLNETRHLPHFHNFSNCSAFSVGQAPNSKADNKIPIVASMMYPHTLLKKDGCLFK
ncbi:hypothetical protein AQUCO_00700876v1 [Aquilegia coerulea]|uniref:Uncharacterized protein n=1 Tax=Aquilegia coerulea TaxID=218851 RepID=A0A2G5EM33_AQUCA|nr:hypothetical protein AQUCO_00700876v1 [Aquilegia coerulea]